MSERKGCKERVYRSGMVIGQPCSNWAKEGSDYCGVHDPKTVEARRKKATEAGRLRFAAKQKEWKAEDLRTDLAEAALSIDPEATPEDVREAMMLRQIARDNCDSTTQAFVANGRTFVLLDDGEWHPLEAAYNAIRDRGEE